MLALFVITTVILAISVVLLVLLNDKHKFSSNFWFEKWSEAIDDYVELAQDYEALDIGNDEIEENYQQEMLSLYDNREDLLKAVQYWQDVAAQLEEIRLAHDYNCLPVLGTDIYPTAEDMETPIHDSITG